jgi:hypothetical protein
MNAPEGKSYDDCCAEASEMEAAGIHVCDGVPVEGYDPETDESFEKCGACGQRRPEREMRS